MADSKPIKVRDVWSTNLGNEFELISDLVHQYPYISMDTKFPGVIFKPSPADVQKNLNYSVSDHYKLLKSNVDSLNLIQLSLTLSDVDGNLPDLGEDNRVIWQFNFRDFNPARDLHAADSVELLTRQGIDFERNCREGVDSFEFAYLMMGSGLVCNDPVSWVTFHSAYDFAYLIKVLTGCPLPVDLTEFMTLKGLFFGDNVYDMKDLMRFFRSTLNGGFDRVAKTLE